VSLFFPALRALRLCLNFLSPQKLPAPVPEPPYA